MSPEERIIETVRTSIMEGCSLDERTQLELTRFRKALSNVITAPRIVSSHEKDITKALMLDLFEELRDKNISSTELKELAKEVVKDYVIEELKAIAGRGEMDSDK